MKKCKNCQKIDCRLIRGLCDNCYHKLLTVQIRLFGKSFSVYTNGVTKEIKPLIPKIKKDTLNAIIKNPRRILNEIEIKSQTQADSVESVS